jgi:CheY-like chemotaxis protein
VSTPTVVFIDDSATMREVIKIAFRRENIDVIAYADALSALPQIEKNLPDVVITDVIMPDKDGYEVCQHIKQHPKLSDTPVILMSGVVNRAVAEKAFSVKADELIRKPFQPQDLITRVKHLLRQQKEPVEAPVQAAQAAAALSSIFASAPVGTATRPRTASTPMATATQVAVPQPIATPPQTAPSALPQPVANVSVPNTPNNTGDVAKLRMEIGRLEGLVKKLQSELAAEREYVRSLEEHFKTSQQQ